METIEQQYLDDLRFFNKTLKAMKGVVSLPDDQMAILDGILLKFFYHAGTIFELYKGTKIDELGAYYWDSSSAAVIVRAAAETFSVFNYLFAEPKNEDETEYRFCQFRLSTLLFRSHSSRTDEEAKKKLIAEAEEIAKIKKRIAETQTYLGLDEKRQRKALKGKEVPQKTELLKRVFARLPQNFTERFYSYLSEYAHTGHSSVIQPLDMDTKDQQIEFYHSFMNFMRPLMFYMVMALIMQFPALEDDPTIKSEIHRRLPERSDYP